MAAAPPKSALVVVDLQGGALHGAWDVPGVVGRVAGMVDRARTHNVPVVWVRHSSPQMPIDSADWQIVPGLMPAPGEHIIEKRYSDSFDDTNLSQVLSDLGVSKLVVTGAQSDACVLSTIFGGFARGYDVELVADGHTTSDKSAYGAPPPDQVIEFINNVWRFRSAPDRKATVITADAFPG